MELLSSLFSGGKGNRALDEQAWLTVMRLPLFDGLEDAERARLRELADQLLADKAFSGAGGIEVEDGMATVIAAFAALPVLNLGYEWYQDWREIVVYPGEYVFDGELMDEHGIVHHVRHERSGEVLEGGPMVLSWEDVEHSGKGEGYNVVIHEFAHKLDMRSGDTNGRPPLHSGIDPAEWAREFQIAYDDLCRRVDSGEETVIDPYATESPAEFFAVLSEYFFEVPDVLKREYPAVYGLMSRFYRQDPLARLN
ncbi:MAG: zinc-dependent peptidase [Gammaproteobacteria bacterium]|nr:zinc-dependent peptidase [Gammaproteobacteria bacterium]MBU1776125.1 zinc-dependent peptidase [Gammaproteobacteria bacterium]MBU1968672.1 zinc-dependent peptidase [Gammaproteobacteria bacterium]